MADATIVGAVTIGVVVVIVVTVGCCTTTVLLAVFAIAAPKKVPTVRPSHGETYE